ncbi:MAG: metallophosphoesterase family protein [Gemmatimonadota bacterium]|nr:metallophosphoesterase family protein [Gemmatimonadota bacterium]
MRVIGVISDTHGLLRDEALARLQGSDLILHAGDVGDIGIIRRLSEIAPVRAVRGNTDGGDLAEALPETDVIDLTSPHGSVSTEGRGPLAYLMHGHRALELDPVAAGFRVLIHGHTHQPSVSERDGVLYFNPGSAGPRRFNLPVTVGCLRIEGPDVAPEVVDLDVD